MHFARQECLYRCMPCSMLRSSLKMVGVHHFLNALVQLPCNILFPYQKSKNTSHKGSCFAFWWRCGELNPGPKSLHRDFLHVYLTFRFFALWYVGEPQIDESFLTTNLQDTGLALSVFLMPLAKGTENLGATR